MNQADLNIFLDLHELWFKTVGKEGQRLDLSNKDCQRLDFSNRNLTKANLPEANLSFANLSFANLTWANLTKANLTWANLTKANLSFANLPEANLSFANLSFANLFKASLKEANDLGDAILAYARGTDLAQFVGFGSQRRGTVYSKELDRVWCGCFRGNLADFEARIKETYPDESDKFRKEYLGIIHFIKTTL